MNILEIRGLHIHYPTNPPLAAVVDFSLEVPEGASFGIVGESGSGKSSVLKAVSGLVRPTSGSVRVAGTELGPGDRAAERLLRRTVQLVFQDPMSSLNPRMSVGTAISEAVVVAARARGETRNRAAVMAHVRRLLDLVGLSASAMPDRYPGELSGGQRQRVAVARALAVRPRLVLLDEVTGSLDAAVQSTILNLLRDLRSELGLSYLVISHDLSVINYLCETTVVMQLGRIMEWGRTEDLLRAPAHPYTRALFEAIPRLGRRGVRSSLFSGEAPDPHRLPSGCVCRTRCPEGPLTHPSRNLCIEQVPRLESDGDRGAVACHYPLTISPARPAPEHPGSVAADGLHRQEERTHHADVER